MMELFLLLGEGTPIHSVSEDFLFLHGNERGSCTAHIILAGVISLALPINLLVGLRTQGAVISLFFGTSLWKISSLSFFFP